MSIAVKFFASLREQIGKGEDEITFDQARTVAQVWAVSTRDAPIPQNTLMAVNMDYVDAEHPVNDGDEVAFFPPVTGG